MLALVWLMQVDYRRYNNPRVVFPAVAVTMLLLIGVFAMNGLAWDASLGSVWRFVHVSAVGAGEAGAGAVSGLLSADSHSPDG